MDKEIPIIGTVGDADLMDKLADAFRDKAVNMRRDRPYNGQSWTDDGLRGMQEVHGVTMRDIRDCFVRAACLVSGQTHPSLYDEAEKGEHARLNTNVLHELNWDKIDPSALAQMLTCEIERAMGIYPNIL